MPDATTPKAAADAKVSQKAEEETHNTIEGLDATKVNTALDYINDLLSSGLVGARLERGSTEVEQRRHEQLQMFFQLRDYLDTTLKMQKASRCKHAEGEDDAQNKGTAKPSRSMIAAIREMVEQEMAAKLRDHAIKIGRLEDELKKANARTDKLERNEGKEVVKKAPVDKKLQEFVQKTKIDLKTMEDRLAKSEAVAQELRNELNNRITNGNGTSSRVSALRDDRIAEYEARSQQSRRELSDRIAVGEAVSQGLRNELNALRTSTLKSISGIRSKAAKAGLDAQELAGKVEDLDDAQDQDSTNIRLLHVAVKWQVDIMETLARRNGGLMNQLRQLSRDLDGMDTGGDETYEDDDEDDDEHSDGNATYGNQRDYY